MKLKNNNSIEEIKALAELPKQQKIEVAIVHVLAFIIKIVAYVIIWEAIPILDK